MTIRQVEQSDYGQWHRMRLSLWPTATQPEDERDMREYLESEVKTAFVAQAADGRLVAFVEANIRHYAEGCATRNVGYIEGWYVDEEYRRQGIGAALVKAAEDWARSRGCQEMASDCLMDNDVSLAAHLALGYEEKERLIHFVKEL